MAEVKLFMDAVHQTLTMACNPHPAYNFKNGHFAYTVVPSTPVLACLQYLITSDKTTDSEKSVFQELKIKISSFMARVRTGENIDRFELMILTMSLTERLTDIFDNDIRARGIDPGPGMVIMAPPENYSGDLEDIPSMLLQTTTNTLVLGVSLVAYKDRVFRHTITKDTHILVALGALSLDNRISADEQAIFQRAKEGADKLNDLKLQGVKVVHPPGLMYVEHRKWYKPMVELFNRDADERGVGRPKWPVISIEGDDTFNMGSEGLQSGKKGGGGTGDRSAAAGKQGDRDDKGFADAGKGNSGHTDAAKGAKQSTDGSKKNTAFDHGKGAGGPTGKTAGSDDLNDAFKANLRAAFKGV